MRTTRHVTITGVVIAAVIGSVSLTVPASAAAAYPSWSDVERARGNEANKQTEITKIEGLISGLQTDAEDKQDTAASAAAEYQTAQYAAYTSQTELDQLTEQLSLTKKSAEESARNVGAVVAQLGRNTGSPVGAELFVSGGDAEDTLYRLSALSKLTSTQADLLNSAEQDANAVSSLTAQADVVASELKAAEEAAESAMDEARSAADAAAAAVSEQQSNEERLVKQLASLKGETANVEEEYQEGVAFRKAEAERKAREEAERIRKQQEAAARAAEEAARIAARAQAAAPQSGNAGGYSAPRPAPAPAPAPVTAPTAGSGIGTYWSPSPQGWYRPSPGPITSPYGPRRQICANGYCSVNGWHAGIDFGAACGTPLKAIYGGTVTAVYYAGGFGNRVIINHGGTESIYGHMQSFGVSVGQRVSAGQYIGTVGKTGVATGCHLDLKINVGGVEQNPAVFLSSKGVGV